MTSLVVQLPGGEMIIYPFSHEIYFLLWMLPWILVLYCYIRYVLQRTPRVLDALGLFIVTRFPFIELFILLSSTGEKARDTLRREYALVYANAAVFLVCGTGMTLDFKRRQCGFAAALHAVIYTATALFQRKSPSEYLIVSKANYI